MEDPQALIKKLEELKRWAANDLPRLAARRAESFTKENWRRQGYLDNGLKPWQKRAHNDREGAAILIGKQSGALRDSIRASVSGAYIRVESSRPYAKIHNEGGTIVQTPTNRQRKFFWAKYYEAKTAKNTAAMERYKRMALCRTLNITIPQRQFMPLEGGAIPFELAEILRGDMEKKISALFV